MTQEPLQLGVNHEHLKPIPRKVVKVLDMSKPMGRPTVMTPEVIQKLETAFMYCYSDEEACLYAGISPATLYNYQTDNPDFLERKRTLKLTPNLVAKKELANQIAGNLDQARWWAHHKMGADFSPPKAQLELSGQVENIVTNTDAVKAATKALSEEYLIKYKQTLRDVQDKEEKDNKQTP